MAAWAGRGPNAIIANASNPVQSQARRKIRCSLLMIVRAWTARLRAMKVRVFIWFVTFFVKCRSHVLLPGVSVRTTGRSSDECPAVTGDTREIRPLWTRKVKESAGRECRNEH